MCRKIQPIVQNNKPQIAQANERAEADGGTNDDDGGDDGDGEDDEDADLAEYELQELMEELESRVFNISTILSTEF